MHDIRISLLVDGAEIESMRFDCDRAVVAMARRPDGKFAIAFSRDDEGMPPVHAFTTGGDGYPGAYAFIWRKVLVMAPPEKAGKGWRLVKAVGWGSEPMTSPRKPGETDAEYITRLAADDPVAARILAIDEAEDTWLLQRDPGETGDDYAMRCLALGCAPDGTLRRWRLAGEDQ